MGNGGRGWALFLVLLAGCGGPSARPAGTGAAEVVQSYYEGLLRQDWRQAYAALHADSRKRLDAEAFARQALAYRRSLGFEPEGVRLASCQEQGASAIARVVFTGRVGGRPRRHKDAVTLRRDNGRWGVVLPLGFR